MSPPFAVSELLNMSTAIESGDRRQPPGQPLSIVSLIPSATEIVAALGLADRLTGRSHECDFPPSVRALPVCTQPKFDPDGTSAEIHDRVTQLLQSALSVYRVEADTLQHIKPTHILTQAQCEVCAVSMTDVEQAVAEVIGSAKPHVISLQPSTLNEVWQDIYSVANALGVNGDPLVAMLKHRVSDCVVTVQQHMQQQQIASPKVACIEWVEPLMAAGNWIPELVKMVGAVPCFGKAGEHAAWITWNDLHDADPDIIVMMPCGYDLKKTRAEVSPLLKQAQWRSLRAVQQRRVYITDGNQYFNRPGPRLVDSLELLAEIFYSQSIDFGYQGSGWEQIV